MIFQFAERKILSISHTFLRSICLARQKLFGCVFAGTQKEFLAKMFSHRKSNEEKRFNREADLLNWRHSSHSVFSPFKSLRHKQKSFRTQGKHRRILFRCNRLVEKKFKCFGSFPCEEWKQDEKKNIQLTLIVSSLLFSFGGPGREWSQLLGKLFVTEIEMLMRGEIYLHNLDY